LMGGSKRRAAAAITDQNQNMFHSHPLLTIALSGTSVLDRRCRRFFNEARADSLRERKSTWQM
jgi:hypothetical protein